MYLLTRRKRVYSLVNDAVNDVNLVGYSLNVISRYAIHCVPKKGSHQTFGNNFVKS